MIKNIKLNSSKENQEIKILSNTDKNEIEKTINEKDKAINFLRNENESKNDSKISPSDINIKGKSLRRQLIKIRKGFSDFIMSLSLDKEPKKQNIKENQTISQKKSNLHIKMNTLNTLPIKDRNNKLKKVAFTEPKIKEENKINNIKLQKPKYLFKSVEFRTTNLNKLYGYNKNFLTIRKKLKKNKESELEKYQDDILRLSSMNLSRDYLLKLFNDLKNIRMNSEKVKPLPPINFKSLIDHSLNKKNKKKEESSKDEKSGEESGEESDEESKENGDEDKKDNKKKVITIDVRNFTEK